MQTMTFKRFLEGYIRSLSKNNTCNIRRLVDEIPENHRLYEPLLLFAMCSNKIDYLLCLVKDIPEFSSYREMSQQYTWDSMLTALENNSHDIGEEYHKVYNSYIRKRDSNVIDNDTKRTFHKRIRILQKEKGISNYRIYSDLELNAGNTNAFLKNGDVGRLCLDTVFEIWLYLKETEKRAS